MKVKIKYCIPVAYYIYGEKKIETDSESFDKISFDEKNNSFNIEFDNK